MSGKYNSNKTQRGRIVLKAINSSGICEPTSTGLPVYNNSNHHLANNNNNNNNNRNPNDSLEFINHQNSTGSVFEAVNGGVSGSGAATDVVCSCTCK